MPIITTWDEIEERGGNDWLTPAEQKLIAACKAGDRCGLGDGNVPPEAAPSPEREIRADVLRYLILGGCKDCKVIGWGIELWGAHVIGGLDLSFQTARGATLLINCRFDTQIIAIQARFEALSLPGSHLNGLNAQRAHVTGSVYLRNITAKASVDLKGATIGGQVACDGAKFLAKKGVALNAQGAHVTGHLFLRNISARASVDVNSATIGGQLDCDGAKFLAKNGFALNAQGAHVTGHLFLRNISAKSSVDVNSATIGGQLDCDGAKFLAERGRALNAQGANVTDSVFLRKVTAKASVDVNGATIGGQLDCDGAKFLAEDGYAFNAQNLNAGALLWRNSPPLDHGVIFNSAVIETIVDDPRCWPEKGKLDLDGLSYQRFAGGPTSSEARIPWLKAGSYWGGEFYPQPFTQCAKVLREMGHEADARAILIQRETLLARDRRRQLKIVPNGDVSVGLHSLWRDFRRGWNWVWRGIFWLVAGYGYRPFNSVLFLIGFIAALYIPTYLAYDEGSFAPNSGPILVSDAWQGLATDTSVDNPAKVWAAKTGPGQDWESFSTLAWSADVVIPIIEFGQTSAWAPSTERGFWGRHLFWMRWVFTIMGWIAAALGAAAVTGIIRRD